MKFSQVALLGAATVAAAQHHKHLHRHVQRRGSPVAGRDVTTTVVDAPVVTVYKLNGQDVPWDEVEQGLEDGKYVIVSDSAAPSSSVKVAGEFFQASKKPTTTTTSTTTTTTSSTTTTTTTTSTTTTSTTTSTTTTSTTTAAPSPSANVSSSGNGVNSEFPSGSIDCSDFPSAYGPIEVPYLGLGNWIGIQEVPDYSPGASAISLINTGVAGGSGCTANSFCSYACPPGYQKSQWPSAQGSTGQSVGGLYCNSNGKLELSRPEETHLCTPGVGNVDVTNELSQNVAICRTDYPGTEGETVPLNTQPGQTYPLTNPDASQYYIWDNLPTSAQYYINPAGVSVNDACQWGTAGSNEGNWAPVNMGVGKGLTGETFISLFQNAPTNTDGKLNFNINITGGISGSCSYSNGVYYSNGSPSSSGCTVSS